MFPPFCGILNKQSGKSSIGIPHCSRHTAQVGQFALSGPSLVDPDEVLGVCVRFLGEDFEEVKFLSGVVLLEVMGS